MKLLVILVFIYGLYRQAIAEELHGIHQRIVNGEPAAIGQFPWQVTVRFTTKTGTFLCSGSLISSKWVLTAAHCTQSALVFTLSFGGLTLNTEETGRLDVIASRYRVHPKFQSELLNNDIALIELDSEVQLNKRIGVIRLPRRGEVFEADQKVTVSGWGKINDNSSGGASNNLNFAELQTISNSKCGDIYNIFMIIASNVCCIGDNFQNICAGDDGGPMVSYNEDGTPTLVGIISFIERDMCSSSTASVHTRTESYLQWIADNTGLNV